MKATKLAKLDSHIIKVLETSLIAIISLIVILSAVWAFQKYFERRIYPFISVETKSLTGQTPQQAFKTLQAEALASQDKISLIYHQNFRRFSLEELGIELDINKSVNQSYKIGRDTNYLKAVKQIPLQISINQEKFNQAVGSLDESIVQPVQDASLAIENGQIIIKPESAGQGVNMDKFKADFRSIIFKPNSRIALSIQAIEPNLKMADLTDAQQKAQTLINRDFSLVYDNKVYTPTQTQKAEWLKFQGDKIVFSEEGIDKYLDLAAVKIEIKPVAKRIYDDGAVEEEGRDGLVLDREKALEDIKLALAQNDSSVILQTQIAPRKVVKISKPFTPGLYDGKYLEIDLSSQMLYQMEGDRVVGSHLVSTGKSGMSTPVGTFKINSKVDRAYSSKYNLYMPYWMAFIGGAYGIHELPEWANGYKEGQSHLGTPVSHGCVRLGVGDAAQVYHWAEVGIPVYIHQ